MVVSRNRRTEDITLYRLVPNPEKFGQSMFQASPSASKVFWAGGGIVTFPGSERTDRIRCKHFEHAIGSALTLPIRPGVLDRLWSDRDALCVHLNTHFVKIE